VGLRLYALKESPVFIYMLLWSLFFRGIDNGLYFYRSGDDNVDI